MADEPVDPADNVPVPSQPVRTGVLATLEDVGEDVGKAAVDVADVAEAV